MTEDEAASAPLIQHYQLTTSDHDEVPQANEVDAPNTFLWALTFTAGISGLLFGYDTGVISSTLVSIGHDLGRPLTDLDKGLITSCTSLGALIASPITGILADRFGRKSIILVADVLFVLGALWQASIATVIGMVAGRTIVGFAVGSASLLIPLYISELSPAATRGKMVTVNVLFITIGQAVAYLLGWLLSSQEYGWRWMVGLGAAPAVLQFGLMLLLPESPRWLVKRGSIQEARLILQKVYATGLDSSTEMVMNNIKAEIFEEHAISDEVSTPVTGNASQQWAIRIRNRVAELLYVGANRRALTIACLLQGLQQLCGFNSLMYFSATIFTSLNFTSPTLISLFIALTNLLFTLVALLLVDRLGRRRILLFSIPVMILGLFAVSLTYISVPPLSQAHPEGSISRHAPPTTFNATIILIAMIVYVSGYAVGLGNIAWQQSELFPLSVRSLGSGLSTATNWSANFVVGLTFLPMMQWMGPSWTFAVYALICAIGWVCAWMIYPETKGLGLEDVRLLLRDGWGVNTVIKADST